MDPEASQRERVGRFLHRADQPHGLVASCSRQCRLWRRCAQHCRSPQAFVNSSLDSSPKYVAQAVVLVVLIVVDYVDWCFLDFFGWFNSLSPCSGMQQFCAFSIIFGVHANTRGMIKLFTDRSILCQTEFRELFTTNCTVTTQQLHESKPCQVPR